MLKAKESHETKFWKVTPRLQATEYDVISAMSEQTDIPIAVFARGLIRLGLQVFHGQETDDLPAGLTREDLAALVQLGVTQAPFAKPVRFRN